MMNFSVKGVPQLRARFDAIKPDVGVMRSLGLTAVAEQKKLVPRKTGNLGRSIGIGSVTATVVETVATANYATYVEFGTRPHTIVPRTKKVLKFTPKASLAPVFAKRVRHPGTKPQPFMVPGAKRAVEQVGFKEAIYREWNGAA